jgi:hypothetical protein
MLRRASHFFRVHDSDAMTARIRRDLSVVTDNVPLDRAFEMLRSSGAWDQKKRTNACARAMRLEPNR